MHVCIQSIHSWAVNNVLQIVFIIGQHQQGTVSKEEGKKLKSKVEPSGDPFVMYFIEPGELRERGEVGTLI